MEKRYKITQKVLGSQEHYFEDVNTLDNIMCEYWSGDLEITEVGEVDFNWISSMFIVHTWKIHEGLKKQKVFIEIVDDSCYGCSWITKIEEID